MGILFETKSSNSVYSHNVGQSEAREIKAGTGSTETWKIQFLQKVAPEHEANKMPVAEDDVCGGKKS